MLTNAFDKGRHVFCSPNLGIYGCVLFAKRKEAKSVSAKDGDKFAEGKDASANTGLCLPKLNTSYVMAKRKRCVCCQRKCRVCRR